MTSQDAFAWAYGTGLSGTTPGSIMIDARLACLSSFYRFLLRMKIVAANPCDAIERPRVPVGVPKGLSADGVQRLLAVIQKTPVGLRDLAIMVPLLFTGRRRAEVFGLKAGDMAFENGRTYSYRGKGGKTVRRELPAPAFEAIRVWLDAAGRDLATMKASESLWPNRSTGKAITSGVFYGNLRLSLTKADCLSRAFTFSATARRNCVGMPVRRWRRCRTSWTTAALR